MFKDKYGEEVKIGDCIIPDNGEELLVVSTGMVAEFDGEVMFGQQIKNMTCFSILTAENLSKQWRRKEV